MFKLEVNEPHPSAGRRVEQGMLQRHVQVLRTRRRPRISRTPWIKGQQRSPIRTVDKLRNVVVGVG